MIIRIKNLRLRTVIGIYDWEKKIKQDVILNIKIEFDGRQASQTDNIDDSVNYKTITKQIIALVEENSFGLVEKIVGDVLDVIMAIPKVVSASVEVDKPGALRYTDSVSVEDSRTHCLEGAS